MNEIIDPTFLVITAVMFLLLGGAAGFFGGYWKCSHDELKRLDAPVPPLLDDAYAHVNHDPIE